MSILYECEDVTVWNPSNNVAQLFLNQARDYAKFLNCESGFADIISDEVQLNKKVIFDFFRTILNYLKDDGQNVQLQYLMRHFCVILGVICFRIDAKVYERLNCGHDNRSPKSFNWDEFNNAVREFHRYNMAR